MKKLLILLLLVVAGGGAYLSKPSDPKRNFTHYLESKVDNKEDVFSSGWEKAEAIAYAETCTYNDNIFWVTVKRDDAVIYTNVYHHWFNRAEIKKDLKKAENVVDKGVNAAKSAIDNASSK